jgi:Glycosyltransferase family 92
VFDHCLCCHRDEARWIAFLDLDEFLFSPTGANVAEVFRDYERWPGVGVNWAMFSHSGHRTRPNGLVIESYRFRDRTETGLIKSVVDPLRTVRCEGAHWFTYEYGLPVDENQWPITSLQTKSTSFERLRINHYASRSAEELRAKVERGSGWTHLRRWRARDLRGELDLVRDDTITRWTPQLKAVLEGAKTL